MDRRRAQLADDEPSGRHTVLVAGEPPLTFDGRNWLVALGLALDVLERQDRVTHLACEVLPNGTVLARDVQSGDRYLICAGDIAELQIEPDEDGIALGDGM